MNPRLAALALWAALIAGVLLIVVMTWHPWVAGTTAGCAAGMERGWDGHCHSVRPSGEAP